MLDDHQIDLLFNAAHGDPFAVLGLHDHAGANRLIALFKRADVAGVFIVVYHFFAVCHFAYLFSCLVC